MESATNKFDENDPRHIKLFFKAEGRFGRIGTLTSCWVPGSFRVAQQTDHNLHLALFAVAVVAERGERAVRPLEIAGRDVVEKNAIAFLGKQSFLDGRLMREQRLQRLISVVQRAGRRDVQNELPLRGEQPFEILNLRNRF